MSDTSLDPAHEAPVAAAAMTEPVDRPPRVVPPPQAPVPPAPPQAAALTPAPPGAAGATRRFFGSDNERFGLTLLDTLMRTLPAAGDAAELDRRMEAAAVALAAFAPRDAVEGMLAAQAVALHHGAMACLSRALLPQQDATTADRLRRQGANLARAMAEMAEAVARRQGKGGHHRQTVRVERVTIEAGAQATVGAVAPPPPTSPPPASATPLPLSFDAPSLDVLTEPVRPPDRDPAPLAPDRPDAIERKAVGRHQAAVVRGRPQPPPRGRA